VNQHLLQVAGHFAGDQTLWEIKPLGNGLINDTFRVSGAATQFVLQRINPQVFPQPQQVMANLERLNHHIQQKPVESVRLQIPAIIRTNDDQLFYQDDAQQCWRALQLISPGESRQQLSHAEEAWQVGFALAHFHALCSDLPPVQLFDTLPGFHIAPSYFQHYQTLIDQPLKVSTTVEFHTCQQYIERFAPQIEVLEQAKHRGELQQRVIHGDPKLNNFLFFPGRNQIVSLIDLDTVKPGLVHYDIGDCLRSSCHDRQQQRFDLERCRLILRSYLQEAGRFFSPADYAYLYPAIWLIPFELGLRFFNDYLAGDVYFKISHPQHNLQRAQAQFALCDSIARQRSEIEHLITRLSKV